MKSKTTFTRHLRTSLAAGFLMVSSQAFGEIVLPDGVFPSNLGVQIKLPDMNAETLDKVKAAGFTWVRRGFIWDGIEKEKDVYSFEQYDKFVALCRERGLGLVAPMAFGNKIHGHPQTESGRKAYAKWAATMAARYKNENILWEIWNEPNTMTFWNRSGRAKDKVKGNSDLYAEEYTNLVREVVPAMKKANPNCYILAGSVSNMWTESYKWMAFCFDKGMLDIKWDAWSVHPYGLKSPEDYIEAYAITRKLMTDAGGKLDRPWFNTERGFPVKKGKEGWAGGSEEMAFEYQAWHLVRQYMIDLLEGVNMTMWYEWGGKDGFALHNEKGEPNPAFNAFKVLVSELDGSKLAKRIPTENPRDFVLQFTGKTGGSKLVVWTSPPPMEPADKVVPHSISIPVEASGTLETSDIYGKKGKVEVKDGKIAVKLTGAPEYITLK